MYCKYCGNRIAAESVFCPFCGKKLVKGFNSDASVNKKSKTVDTNYTERAVRKSFSNAEIENLESKEAVTSANTVGDISSIWGSIMNILKVLWKVICAIIIILGLLYQMDPYHNIINIKNMRKAYSCAQEVISDNILVKEYEFPQFDPEFVTQRTNTIVHEGNEYRVHTVSSYVYAENVFGVMMRTDYIIEIGFPTDSDVDGYYYEIISIE